MNSKISDKDKKDWDDFLSSSENLPDKDLKLIKKNSIKTKTYDLHGYSLDDANKKIRDFIHEAYNEKISKLIIVTGKGLHSQNEKDPYVSKDLGILKYSVPEYIKSNLSLSKYILSVESASKVDGGSGAIIIKLKRL